MARLPRRAVDRWRRIAIGHQLVLDESDLHLDGDIDKVRIQVAPGWTMVRRNGRADDVSVYRLTVTATVTHFAVEGLVIRPEKFEDRVNVALFGVLPDIQFGDEFLDHWLHVKARDRARATQVMQNTRLIEVMRAAGRIPGVQLYAIGGAVRLVVSGSNTMALLGQLVEWAHHVAVVLRDSEDDVLRGLSRRHRLSMSASGATGVVRGVPISVRPVGDRVVTYIVKGGVPAGFDVEVGPKKGRRKGIQLGDMVLDGNIHVTCPDAASARSLLGRDDVRAPLLSIVHGHGGIVDDTGIYVECTDDLTDLMDLVDDVVDLGVALAHRLASS